jgi:predicted TIM-barrel fold metal-dependent hydrolase
VWSFIADPDAYRATIRAYNDWLAQDYCSTAPDRLLGMGVVPWTGARDAIAEMEHCAKLGLKGVVLGIFPGGKGYPTQDDDEFWAAALAMNMPLTVHFGFDRSGPRAFQPILEYPGVDEKLLAKLRRRHLAVTVSYFGLPSSLGMTQLILSSVFDRFPDLRLFFAETRLGWVPFWAETADYWVDQHRAWHERLLGFKPMKRPFSEYVRDNFLFSVHAIEHVALDLRDRLDPHQVMFATDFPHVECQWPHTRKFAEQFFARLPADAGFRIAAGNMIEFFRMADTPVARAALARAP